LNWEFNNRHFSGILVQVPSAGWSSAIHWARAISPLVEGLVLLLLVQGAVVFGEGLNATLRKVCGFSLRLQKLRNLFADLLNG